MKVLIINTSECTGGAAIAAGRLMEALNKSGISAEMTVLHKKSNKPYVFSHVSPIRKFMFFAFERLVIWANNLFSRKNLFKVSIANTGIDVTSLPEFQRADIINLHWINQGMLSLDEIKRIIKSGKPTVWTMHDMWECTAICHCAYECNKFTEQCGECQYLRFPRKNDLSHKVFLKKLEIFQNSGIHFVAVSSWLKNQAKKSTLLKGCDISVIPNTLSLSDFTISDKADCRKQYKLAEDKYIILFGAARIDDPIKGFNLLTKSLEYLIMKYPELEDKLHLVLFGNIKDKKLIERLPVNHTYTGTINNTKELSKLYSAADVAVSASYYETFGQTIIEAQACGCLPVSFGNSGQSDIIEHKRNGYLAEYMSVEDLAEGIVWCLKHRNEISDEYLRKTVKDRYDISVVAEKYVNLYKTLNTKENENTVN